MEYTVQKLGSMAKISTRTLRYYDEIGILKPARINSSGYRIYGEKEVDRLQQIMFYRELGVDLDTIKNLVTSASFDSAAALEEHHAKLLAKREQLNLLIANVEKTMEYQKGRIKMKDKEKFEGFKKKLVEDNEQKYGQEIRAKYGDETVNASNQKLLHMTQEQYTEFEKLTQEVLDTLEAAFATGDPAGEMVRKLLTCTRSGLPIPGAATARKHMQALRRCMWMIRDLPHTMIKSNPVWQLSYATL
jgi:DNA-binding transcriptional MerR regulator